MGRSLAVVNCGQIATLAGPARPRINQEMSELSLVENSTLLVVDGIIKTVGPDKDIPVEATLIDAGGRVVLPGFVDAHTHLGFAGHRADEFEARAAGITYEELAKDGGGILSTVKKTREASLEELIAAGRKRLDWMIADGTTTIEAKSGYGLTFEEELKILLAYSRLNEQGPMEIVPTLLAPHAIPPEFAGRLKEYVGQVAIPLLKRAKQEGLAQFADAFCEEGYFGEAELQPYFDQARALGFKLRLHVDQLCNSKGAEMAARFGAKTADHLEYTNLKGIQALKRSDVMPVLLPSSVFALGKTKYPDARTMIDRGLPVVLATDFNPGSSPVLSMAFVMSLACTQMKMSPAEAISASTINAAYSLSRGQDRGSLEAGKRADFVIHDVEDYREIPYWIGRQTAWKVFINGAEAWPPARTQ